MLWLKIEFFCEGFLSERMALKLRTIFSLEPFHSSNISLLKVFFAKMWFLEDVGLSDFHPAENIFSSEIENVHNNFIFAVWRKVSSCDIDVFCIVVCKSSPVAAHPIFNIKGNKTFLVELYSCECECRILWVDRRNGAQWWFWQPLWFGIWKVPPHKLFPCQSK